jgi:fumigallin biosynthesis monooxygenase-like protein
MVIQYWRSFEDLERFARSPDAPHLAAWKEFNASVRDSGDVGIWHETYRIAAGASESIYGNMPARGLGAAGTLQPIGTTAATAAKRIGAREIDEAPVEAY